MENKETITATAQPELYKCDCCQDYSTTHYDLDIQVEFEDEAARNDTGWREWLYRLCRHCDYNWLEGRMSTKELIMRCNWNIDNARKLREAAMAVSSSAIEK